MSDVERTDIYRAFDKETTRWLWLREQERKRKEGNDERPSDGD
jgi:hypothetical protein